MLCIFAPLKENLNIFLNSPNKSNLFEIFIIKKQFVLITMVKYKEQSIFQNKND